MCPLPGPRQFLATENHLKIMENASYFNLKLLLVFKVFKFFPDFFGHAGKRFDQKTKVKFKIYEVIKWKINNCNTHIAQYL